MTDWPDAEAAQARGTAGGAGPRETAWGLADGVGRMPDCPDAEAADAYGNAWAAVYDDEHRLLVPGEDQLGLLEDLANGRPALERGIGTGRVALPLAARGVDLAGVDASPSMVE